MDADFFAILRSTGLAYSDPDARRLLEFLDDEFGSSEIGMETFYSQAFLHDQFVGEVPAGDKGRLRRYENSLMYFRRVLPRVFAQSLSSETCRYHEALVDAVSANDVFISFNYDCLIDHALADRAGRTWRPDIGYGFNIHFGLNHWCNHDGYGRMPKTGIRLLKPHGSLNWTRRGSQIGLRTDAYEDRGEDDLLIVPPLWQKNFDTEPYHAVWTTARSVLRSVKALLVLGYSLPVTDVYTQALFRIDVEGLDFLCIANPDRDARTRIKSVLRSAISARTHVVELDSIEALADLLVRESRT